MSDASVQQQGSKLALDLLRVRVARPEDFIDQTAELVNQVVDGGIVGAAAVLSLLTITHAALVRALGTQDRDELLARLDDVYAAFVLDGLV